MPPGADLIVVPALSGCDAPHLRDLNSATRATEIEGPAFQPDNAVAQAQQLQVPSVAVQYQLFEQQNRRFPCRKELLQGEDLSAEAERLLCQQPHFRNAVEHHPGRRNAIRLIRDQLDGLAELYLPRVQQRHLAIRARQVLSRRKLEKVYAVERQP
jgi:hypothetical protein